MISYLIVGADDMVSAKRFYLSFLPALNYVLQERTEGLSFTLEKQTRGRNRRSAGVLRQTRLRWTSSHGRQRLHDRFRSPQSKAGA